MVKSGEKGQLMLIGNFSSKLNLEKGRTSLPKQFRQVLGDQLVITAGYENTLMIVSKKDWQSVVGGITNRPFISGPARETDRFLLGSAFEVDLDSQGRFIIPPALRDYARLSEEIVFVGVGNRLEVWEASKWRQHLQYLDENIEKIARTLDEEDQQ